MILITMRLADMKRVHPKQITGKCSVCGHEVGIFPSGQAALKADASLNVVCQKCMPQNSNLMLAPGALLEPFQTKDKP